MTTVHATAPEAEASLEAASRRLVRAAAIRWRILIATAVIPLAVAVVVSAHRLGVDRRAAAAADDVRVAVEAAERLQPRAPDGAGTSRDRAPVRTAFEALNALGYDASFQPLVLDPSGTVTAAGPPTTSAELPIGRVGAAAFTELVSRDRAFATRLGPRAVAIAPIKDADRWDVTAGLIVARRTRYPAQWPAAPLVVGASLILLSSLAVRASARRPLHADSELVRRRPLPLAGWDVLLILLPLVFAAFMLLVPQAPGDGSGSYGFWTVSSGLAAALAAAVGIGLAATSDRPARTREALAAWAFLAPSFVHLLLFSIGPIVFSLWLSLHEWNLLDPVRTFVGLENYGELAQDGDFWRAVRNTAVYVLFVPIGMMVALALALLVDRRFPGARALRGIFFLPYVTSFVAISLVWRWMFEPDFGLFNHLLRSIGLPPQPWLGSPATALPSLMLMSVWMYAGYMMVLFLAGLQSIPASLYESARIDGANAWQRFRRITLPLLRPTTLFVLVTMVIFMFQVFTAVYVMTEGGPLHATDVVVYHIYRNAWEYLRMGYASAMSWVLFAMIFIITLVQFRWLGGRRERA